MNSIFEINKDAFNRKSIVNEYKDTIEFYLQSPEEVIFSLISEKIQNKKILDLGVGGGRTTKFLIEISKDYIGADYAYEMVKECQNIFPELEIMQLDARDLTIFEDNTFDFILFSYNGIDYANHVDRILILKEVNRTLRPNGYFAFSTHNLNMKNKIEVKKRKLFRTRNIKSLVTGNINIILHNFKHYRRFKNQNKLKTQQVIHEDYHIKNDVGHKNALLTYYTSAEKQKQQLTNYGFKDVLCFNKDGETVDDCELSAWLYYLCKK